MVFYFGKSSNFSVKILNHKITLHLIIMNCYYILKYQKEMHSLCKWLLCIILILTYKRGVALLNTLSRWFYGGIAYALSKGCPVRTGQMDIMPLIYSGLFWILQYKCGFYNKVNKQRYIHTLIINMQCWTKKTA